MNFFRLPLVVTVYLVDTGSTTTTSTTNLYVLPEMMQIVLPCTFQLYIVGLIPLDFEKTWTLNENNEIFNFLEIVRRANNVFKCTILFGYRNILISSTFIANENLNYVTCLFEQNFATYNINILADTKNLISKGNALEQTFYTENWKNLVWNEKYIVNVTKLNSPNSFFVCLDLTTRHTVKKSLTAIENSNEFLIPLRQFEIGSLCILKIITECKRNNYKIYRVKIVESDQKHVLLFLVDYGIFDRHSKTSLYEFPDCSAMNVTFQTIHCSMIEFENQNHFEYENLKTFFKTLTNINKFEIKVINEIKTDLKFCSKIKSYNVVLRDAISKQNFSEIFNPKNIQNKPFENSEYDVAILKQLLMQTIK